MSDGKNDKDFCKYHYAIERAIKDQERLLCAKLKHMEAAVDLARGNLENRLEGMNEFRNQLEKQTATFVTREANDLLHKSQDDRIITLEKAQNRLAGIAATIAVIFIIIQIVLSYLKI